MKAAVGCRNDLNPEQEGDCALVEGDCAAKMNEIEEDCEAAEEGSWLADACEEAEDRAIEKCENACTEEPEGDVCQVCLLL